MILIMYVTYFYWPEQHGRHGQPVQDLGRGQGLYPLPQDLDKVAETKILNKIENLNSILPLSDSFMMKLYYNKD